uniref:trypsin-like peptidase domain-containing protein n=1 Tax=Saccharothrix mutabilis TaxID=33921 RepID=UPI0031D849F6
MARFVDGSGRTVGAGVVLSRTHVVTCAHVVNLAAGLGLHAQERPVAAVRVEFPALPGAAAMASVASWTPPPEREGSAGGDLAVLAFAAPDGVEPAHLVTTPPRPGDPVDVFGFPRDRPDGAWVRAVVRGRVSGGLLQLDSVSALKVQRGYSGGPVWDPETGRVVGVVVTTAGQDSYAITADRLRSVWPERWRERRGDAVTVLHTGATRFGDDEAPWFGRLHDAVADVRPDLVVFSGDLTAAARPSEFERGFRFLAHLAEAVELPRSRVVVVPGARDVNLLACRAYFAQEEALERTPVPPYWPKWGPFAAAFDAFYDGAATFTPDEPWSVFGLAGISVVVAGVNSTIPLSHENSVPDAGEAQVTRLNRRLREFRRRAWLRLGVVHRAAPPRLDVNAVLCGRDDGAWFDVVAFGPDGATRRAHHYDRDDGRWVADTPDRPAFTGTFGPRDRRLDAAAPARDSFFERVLEATRVAHPAATVTPIAELSYLRVSEPREGGGFEQWPVGVVAEAAPDRLDAFLTGVHSSFAAADPTVPSELVYGGPPAPADLVLAARRKGVRLRSFVEYQGLLDLRPLVARQARRLADDLVYPAELYVPQRYAVVGTSEVREDVLARVVHWLGRETARFVVVLGDFGRGKSFLLRQLTRELPRHLPGVLPVLVELRSLEKAPTLDELLAQHLVREGVEAVDVAKLRYMIGSGRLALLFDGFDELELRVGYDNAADYLGTLLKAVTDRAKVVLTSRSQHFRSTSQVLTALGRQVSALSASRSVVLEDFTDDQILDFLTRHYRGDAERARRRFALLGAINDLLGLSRNPRMLSFIADLDEDRLLDVRREHGRISAAELYRELVDFWLLYESKRQEHRHGTPSFEFAERLAACTALALRLWETTATTIQAADLADTVVSTLNRLAERGYSIDQAAHALGSGTLLVRTENGFAFVHQSVVEWLVALSGADRLRAGAAPGVTNRRMSRLMVDFLCDLAGHSVAVAWARGVLADVDAGPVEKQNATAVVQRLNAPTRLELSGVDLRATDLGRLDLRGAHLRGAVLSGQRLVGKDLSGADLRDADLSGVVVVGGSLEGALLAGSRWRRAALLGVRGAVQEELAEAAVAGRDPAAVVIEQPTTPERQVVGVAFTPDGRRLVIACGDLLRVFDLVTGELVFAYRDDHLRTLDLALDGSKAVTTNGAGEATIWLLGDSTGAVRLPGSHLRSAAFSPDGLLVVTADDDEAIGFWDGDTGAHIPFPRPDEPVDVVLARYSPDGRHVLLAHDNGSATLMTGGTARPLTGHLFEIGAIAVSPDSRLVATGAADGVRVSGVDGGVVSTIEGDSAVRGLAFSPDGTLVAAALADGSTWVWEVGGGPRFVVNGHRAAAGAVAFSPGGRRIATGGDDGTVRIWDAATGEEVGTVVLGEREVVLLPDGHYKGTDERVFWAVKRVRFEAGELDPHYPHLRGLRPGQPLPGKGFVG